MTGNIYTLSFDGALLARGFWLYIWQITTAGGDLYYIGRTGDSSSINAQSPFNRMGQHLSFDQNSNVLRRHLEAKGVCPEECSFLLVAHGPIQRETKNKDEHRANRDTVAALEKALACAMATAGYNVINTVYCRKSLNTKLFEETLEAFAVHFPELKRHKHQSVD